jgi:hypothetical protein
MLTSIAKGQSLGTSARKGRRRFVLCTTVFLGLVGLISGCAPDRGAPAPAPPPSPPAEIDLVVLPNNTVLHSARGKVTAVRREGEVAWELSLPYGDALVSEPAVALNSVAYFRGSKGIYAATPDGKWAWSKPLENRSTAKTRGSDTPVSFPDSTVAVAVGDDIVRFDDRGAVRWRISLPEGHVNARMSAGMDGALFVPTTVGIYCLSPDGNVVWRRVPAG